MKALGLLSVVAALAGGGYLVKTQLQSSGPASEAGHRIIVNASTEVTGANLGTAARALEAAHAATGTYAGAPAGVPGVRVVRADAAGYCLEAGEGAAVVHVRGPGGSPSVGRC